MIKGTTSDSVLKKDLEVSALKTRTGEIVYRTKEVLSNTPPTLPKFDFPEIDWEPLFDVKSESFEVSPTGAQTESPSKSNGEIQHVPSLAASTIPTLPSQVSQKAHT